jgi:hypothetical protein
MPKHLSGERIAQIREEVRRARANPKPDPPTVRILLSCGHEEDVPAGLDPNKSICGQCRAKSMRSTQ